MADLPIGRAVKKVRNKRGWTQKQLAIRAGVNENSVWMMERETNNPQVNTFENFAVALEIEPWRLMYIACKIRERLEA